MPASAAQVFGPNTVDPGFNSTGEKTLLTMSTTLAAGGRNVIIAILGKNSQLTAAGLVTLRIYKDTTLLYEEFIQFYANSGDTTPRHITIIAVDNTPAGNDSYSFRINVITASSSSGLLHVQGIVIKTDDAVWGYNSTAVSIGSGATATVTSISTTFQLGFKVALIAVVYGSRSSGSGFQLIGAGNIRLKSGATTVSSNEFNQGAYDASDPFWVVLAYLDTPTADSQSYSVEVTNGSGVTFNCYAEIVAFTVFDGAFLDTASVALTSGVQVTVGNLSTVLTGDVVAIGLAASVNTGAAGVTAFNANDVTLQLNNLTTGSVNNLTGWHITRSGASGMSAILPLFRIDTGVSNPSYQIKMRSRASGINGEAKILVFSLFAGVDIKKVFGETLQLLEQRLSGRLRFRYGSENVSIVEAFNRFRNRFRYVIEEINLIESNILSRAWIKIRDEIINLIDAFQRTAGKFRQALEVLNIVETASVIKSRVLQVSEMVRVSEIVTRFRQRFRKVVEVINLNEAILISRGVVRRIVELVRLLESFKVLSNKFRSFMETVRIGETFNSFRGSARQVVEIVNIGEVSSRLSNLFRSVVESVRIGEFVGGMRNMFIRVLENVNVIESITLSRVLVRIRNEFIEVGELFSSFVGRVNVVGENIRIIETLLLSSFKTYIKRLKSILRGMSRSNLVGSSKGGEL